MVGGGMGSPVMSMTCKKKYPSAGLRLWPLTNLCHSEADEIKTLKLAIVFPYWLGSGERRTTNESEAVKCREDKCWHVSFSLLKLQCCCNDISWKKIDKEEDLHSPANFISADIWTRLWTWGERGREVDYVKKRSNYLLNTAGMDYIFS